MPSNLACVGLGVSDNAELERLVRATLPAARPLGEVAGIVVHRWEDPSGARMVICTQGNEVFDLLPSFAGTPGALLANLWVANESVTVADIVDGEDEKVGMLALALEQRLLLPLAVGEVRGPATVVALGVDVHVHRDAEAFSASEHSLLNGGDSGQAPAHFVERGWPWPPRLSPESFISFGVFGAPDEAEAHARLNGTVLSVSQRTVVATGQRFVAARVRTAGFEVDLCLPDSPTGRPVVGNVVGGTVYLVGSMPFPITGG